MRGRGHILGLAFALLILWPTVARADARTEARRHFRQGMALIQEGEIDDGVAALLLAYEALPHPNVLYNIGVAYAEAGRYAEAIDYLERYLASEPPDAGDTDALLTQLRAELAAEQAAAQADAPPAETEVTEAATDEELAALAEAADRLEALAAATESEAMRERAAALRALAENLRGRRVLVERTGAGEGETTPGEESESSTAEDAAEDEAVEGRRSFEGANSREDNLYEERVISAARFEQSPLDAALSTTIVTRQDIRLSGLTAIPEILRRVAGIDVMTVSPGDHNVGIRGFNARLAQRVIVMVDGRNTNLDFLGSVVWNTLPVGVEDIERIEIIRGPASAVYGANAFSGVINIVTRAPGEQSVDLTAGGGTHEWFTGHASASGQAGRFGYRFSAGYDRANRFESEVSADRVDLEINASDPSLAYERFRANGTLSYQIADGYRASLQAGVVTGTSELQLISRLRDSVFTAEPLNHLMGVLETPYGQVRAYWNHATAEGAPTWVARGQSDFRWRMISDTFDVEAVFNRSFELGIPQHFVVGVNYRYKAVDHSYLDAEHDQHHFGVFLQDTLTVTDWFLVHAAVRVDIHPLLDTPPVSPRVSLVFKPTERSSIRASFATAFRTPAFLESYLQTGVNFPLPAFTSTALGTEVAAAGRLDAERIMAGELGYRTEDLDALELSLDLYYNYVTNLAPAPLPVGTYRAADYSGVYGPAVASFDPYVNAFVVGQSRYLNVPDEYHVIGGELGARVFPVDGLDIYANYALQQSIVENESSLSELQYRLDNRISDHKFNLGVQYRAPFGLDLSVDLHVASEQRWREFVLVTEGIGGVAQEFVVPTYYLVNARVGWRLLGDQLELGVVGFNITDNRIRQHPFAQRLGARVMGTVAIHL